MPPEVLQRSHSITLDSVLQASSYSVSLKKGGALNVDPLQQIIDESSTHRLPLYLRRILRLNCD